MSAVLPLPDDLGVGSVVFAGGDGPTAAQYDAIVGSMKDGVRVVAADSGAEHARTLGIHVDVAVGDFDSASEATKEWLNHSGSEVRAVGVHKDHSDLELGLAVAGEGEPETIVVLGLGGGRPDHGLFNLLVLADAGWSGSRVLGLSGDCWITVVHARAVLTGEPGSLVSLVPVGGPVTVTTAGLMFPLQGEELIPTSARGLSNVIVTSPVVVRVESGVLLAMQPTGDGWDHD
ncbi:MAG: thiamine diphosphokinase [Acidimicrobiia bacterium]|nr:thiamine diphosphokinase [Acidimicrobiia bacterium]